MTIFTYRVFYRFEHDDVEYAALIEETSEQNARNALMSREPITITRVEVVGAGSVLADTPKDADQWARKAKR